MVSALSYEANGITDTIITPVKVKNALNSNQIETRGLWDTGAQNSAITKKAAELLSLPIIGKTQIRGVHGIKEVNVYYIEIVLNNPNITVKCNATECEELSNDGTVNLLLGMNVISRGDFVISNFEGHTTMTFRVPSLESINFVREMDEYNKIAKIFSVQSKKGIKRCPCGSGKDFKNCHGKSIYNNR